MSFRVNNVNYSCSPMYNQNNNNNVMGYLCSSRNVENFYETGLKDSASSANRGQVKSKDDGSFWKYMGSVSINSSDQGSTSSLRLRCNDNNLADNQRGINKLISGFGVSEGLPFIFHFHAPDGNSYVMRSSPSNVKFEGNELVIHSPRGSGIHDNDFDKLKRVQGAIQLRVGVFDINNGSQRQNIESKWN